MSKQKNKKFKKAKKQQQVFSYPTEKTAGQSTTIPAATPTQTVAAPISAEVVEIDKMASLNAEYAYVRKDIKLILLTILFLVVLLVAAYFIGQKTSLLKEFGSWIYKIGNFKTS